MKTIYLVSCMLAIVSVICLLWLHIIFLPQKPFTEKHIIKWCAVETGATGQGPTEFSKEKAKAIAQELNLEYGELLIHWAEKVPTRSETCIVGQVFEAPKKVQTWICCEPGVWEIIEENHEWSDNETVVGIVKGIDTTEINP